MESGHVPEGIQWQSRTKDHNFSCLATAPCVKQIVLPIFSIWVGPVMWAQLWQVTGPGQRRPRISRIVYENGRHLKPKIFSSSNPLYGFFRMSLTSPSPTHFPSFCAPSDRMNLVLSPLPTSWLQTQMSLQYELSPHLHRKQQRALSVA